MANISELRQDIVSGEWVTIATGRAKRPQDFLQAPRKPFQQPKKECPFEELAEDPLLVFKKAADREQPGTKGWFIQVIKNKYPAFAEGTCKIAHADGLYTKMDGAGHHEVVVTADHTRSLAEFTREESALLIEAYLKRFHDLKARECVDYVSVFHNHGPESGASITHPHSQIITLPVVPPDVQRSITGSHVYFQKEHRCVHCDVIEYEQKAKTRIVYENDHALVVCPFASKTAFEMRIFPKEHEPDFHIINADEIVSVGDALQNAVARLYKGLNNPSYNFFIHTAPTADHKTFQHYHWHIEILPKTAIWAGFEIGTGIEISTIAPEAAAEFLRSIQ